MIKIEHVVLPSAEQMKFVIEGMRNPKNSWERSDSRLDGDKFDRIGENDSKLMHTLAIAGTEHRKYLRMMPIYLRVTAPLYWWKEFDTYKVGTVSNSCSTMHKIHAKKFTKEDFSLEHLGVPIPVEDNELELENYLDLYLIQMSDTIRILNVARDHYNSETDPEVKKQYWWQMIQLLPTSYNQTRNVMINYEVALEIYRQRKNHKLDEWHTFCDWIEKLPYIDIFMENEEDKNAAENNKPDNGDLLRVECDSYGQNYAVMSKDGKISKVPITYVFK